MNADLKTARVTSPIASSNTSAMPLHNTDASCRSAPTTAVCDTMLIDYIIQYTAASKQQRIAPTIENQGNIMPILHDSNASLN